MLVSIIIPVYNAEKFIRETIDSCINQTYKDIEIILINDGSTDDSASIMGEYEKLYKNIKCLHQINQGACVARNRGIAESNGVYIKFLDADDTLYVDAIEKQVKASSKLKDNEIIFGDYNYIDANGVEIHKNIYNLSGLTNQDQTLWILQNWYILISAPLHRAEVIKKLKGFDVNLKSGQESDLHFRLALNSYIFVYSKAVVFSYRSHNSEDRISVNRITKKNNFADLIYRYNKHINLIKNKHKAIPTEFKAHYSQNLFGIARRFFSDNYIAEGKFFYGESIKINNKIPKYQDHQILGYIYYALGNIIGYSTTEKLIRKIRKNKKKDSDLKYILN